MNSAFSMEITSNIDINRYRYTLPDSSVAKYPLEHRDQSKLLVYDHGQIGHNSFRELPQVLPKGSWLVFNNTRVIQARLQFRKSTGASIEIFCLEPFNPADYQQSFESRSCCSWKCLVGNSKKWKQDSISLSTSIGDEEILLEAILSERSREYHLIQFDWNNPRYSFGEIIEFAGSTPIPPYLNRKAEESDRERYQTIYSRDLGSVAAPTAGLHFSEQVTRAVGGQGYSYLGDYPACGCRDLYSGQGFQRKKPLHACRAGSRITVLPGTLGRSCRGFNCSGNYQHA